MASNLPMMKDKLRGVSIVGVLLLVHAACSETAFAQDSADTQQQYEWSAELVSFDQGSGTATLKARMDTRADKSVLESLSEGDRITITWTGLTWGAGIADISREGPPQSSDRLDLPAEFVGTEMDDTYVLFRVPVPRGSAASLRGLSSGDWVTAATPHDATELNEAVSEIRPYNDVG